MRHVLDRLLDAVAATILCLLIRALADAHIGEDLTEDQP